ncbi:MAG: helix-turn-helix domain-containing protein [Bdellovibrionaceae bacterium]|nr:helix-turn-helix domain-containing protein [Pseudobdellovibrionaceae bacterium]
MSTEPKVGRPSLFNDAIREKIIALAEQGKTNEQIAEIIGVHVRTIENWQGKHKDLMWALREAKLSADELVEASLFSRAVGYTHPEEKSFCYEGVVVTHNTQKHHPPDIQAAMFWLKNRQPDKWREKQPGEDDKKVTLDGSITVTSTDLADRISQFKSENE